MEHQLKLHIESVEDRIEELEREAEKNIKNNKNEDILASDKVKNKENDISKVLQNELS